MGPKKREARPKKLREQTIVITGASSGIGLATARMAAARGANVVLTSRNEEDLRRATESLPREYRQQLLAETSAVLWALVTQQPGLTGWQPVQAWVAGELKG